MGGLHEMDDELGSDSLDSRDEDLNLAMEEELAKGESSSVPEDTMAALSVSKDIATGKEPFTRETLGAAIEGKLGELQKRKAELYSKMQSGEALSSSQTVGLGILALGLMAAGGALKGKKGISQAGNAFNLGGSIFLKQNKEEADNKNRLLLSEMKSLNANEAALAKAGLENKMAPLKTEEKIEAQTEARRRMVKEGTLKPGMNINVNTGALVKGELPAAVQQKIIEQDGAIAVGEEIANELAKLPDTTKGVIQNQISKQFTATPRGQVESKYALYRRILQSAIEGKRGSDQDNKIFSQIVNGDFTASGPTQAKLIRQANKALNRITLSEVETYQELGTPEGVERFKEKLKAALSQDGEGSTVSKKPFLVNGTKMLLSLDEIQAYQENGDDIQPFTMKKQR